ncbi:DUF402 domain-containing protein [Thermocrispum municipale]|jgi:hypothetical protein|uniref:DUF402 domain-containing protein n=1 Tax=Thermocrispum municipale TaxID=37926 RepID=UPI00048D913D|nr:DUF402 domain-containing protein [Thermocrispum municipale]
MNSVHPPKVERFDVAAMTNTDNKGIVRAVDEYRVEPFGLYMARPTPGRKNFAYLESWLLPDVGLRISDFHFTPGHERDQDFYLDVVQIDVDGDTWTTRDLYLDLVLRSGKDVELVDADELIAATTQGLIPEQDAVHAIHTATSAASALAAHGHDLHRWLATRQITLSWRRHS